MEIKNDDPRVVKAMGSFERFKKLTDLSPVQKKVIIILILIGLLVTFLPYIFLSKLFDSMIPERNKKGCTENVTAVVTEQTKFDESSNDALSDSFAPVFSYEYNEISYKAESHVYSNEPTYNIGDKVELLIDPNDPQRFYDPNQKKSISLYSVLLVFPVLYAAFVLNIFLKVRKLKKAIDSVGYEDGTITIDEVEKSKIHFDMH